MAARSSFLLVAALLALAALSATTATNPTAPTAPAAPTAAPVAPAPFVPSAPTNALPAVGADAPFVPFTPLAPNAAVNDPRVAVTASGATASAIFNVVNIAGFAVTPASFGGAESSTAQCSTAQCRVFRTAVALAAGAIPESQVTIVSFTALSGPGKFAAQSVEVTVSIAQANAVAALTALLNIQSRIQDGTLGTTVGARLTNGPAVALAGNPTTPAAPVSPDAPAVPFAPVDPAAVADSRIAPSTTGVGAQARAVLAVGSINGAVATVEMFTAGPGGIAQCDTSFCRDFRAAVGTAAGVAPQAVTVVSADAAAAGSTGVSVAVLINAAGGSQAALTAVRLLESRTHDGTLGAAIAARVANTPTAAPAVPAPAVPSVPTSPIAPLAPHVTTTVPNVAPNAVVSTPLIVPSAAGGGASTLSLTWNVNGVNGQSATTASFGGNDCSTTQCRAFRAALATSAGVSESQVAITSVAAAGGKFEVLAVSVGTAVSAASAQAALQALVNLQARAANGNLGGSVGASLTGSSATPINPTSAGPFAPFTPTAPLSPAGGGPIAIIGFTIKQSLATFTPAVQLEFRQAIATAFNLSISDPAQLARVQIRTFRATTYVAAHKFSLQADGTLCEVAVQPGPYLAQYNTVAKLSLYWADYVKRNNFKVGNFNISMYDFYNLPNAATASKFLAAFAVLFAFLASFAVLF